MEERSRIIAGMAEPREILHVDMDAFYAAVEQRDNPELRGKPVLVGGDPGGRGVISTASYEARVFGCRSAMPTSQALRLCPQAIVVRPRMGHYAEASRQVFAIFEQFTPLVEPLSLDEAFLDVGGSRRLFGDGPTIAREIRRLIRERTQLTASIGVAPNKFIAKLASDLKKPDGLVIVAAERVLETLDPLPISRLWGVGKATLPRFERAGIHTFRDLRVMPAERARAVLGDSAEHYQALVRGEDDRPVVPDRDAKSISHETTFAQDIGDAEVLRGVLLEQIEQVAARLRRHERFARCVVLKVRTPDFATFTRQATLDAPTDVTDEFWKPLKALFDTWMSERRTRVRLIGAGVSHLSEGGERQMGLFEEAEHQKRRKLDATVDAIRSRFGTQSITRGLNADRGDRREDE